MLMIPLPLFIAEVFIFFSAVQHFGFLNTVGLYIAPCVLGFLIVSMVGRLAMMNLQGSLGSGQLPANKLLHSGAIFLSGLLFLIPSFSTRLVGLILLLPGLRHLAVWRFKISMAKKMAAGAQGFNFSSGPFGFSAGSAGRAGSGFRYYQYRGPQEAREDIYEENIRDVSQTVLDVTPLEITHEKKDSEDKA